MKLPKGLILLSILSMTGLAAEAQAAPRGGLPLRRGTYVDLSSDCRGASSSTRTWFSGGYVIHAAHARCSVRTASRTGAHDYAVKLACLENGDPSLPFSLNDRIHVVSHTEYVLKNSNGRFRARWCRG